MRYSMLVYIVKMCQTLTEAAKYISAVSEGELRAELLENGKQMFVQKQSVLEQHRRDLCSAEVLDKLCELEAQWQSGGNDLAERIDTFANELPASVSYQARAVFFAELGEKWDAMESVYEYMRDDPRFDPIIVRTPVGRVVERDGKREQEILYKDFLTPMGVPSLGYDEYNIEDDCPELAFISQPYESCTLEQFWPENIAKHTRLVYLPYFLPFLVLKEHKETLCQLPVYRHAWKVIGASERHYGFYKKYAVNGGGNMLITGLPKLDPVVKLRNSKTPIPKQWRKVVEGRKVFLWNTWYDYSSSSIDYFDTIMEWFRSHDDCALIWRRHPLTDTVTRLYYSPEVYAKLQSYIEAVGAMENGICDDEAPCDISFSCSDAQISDYSSLMCQYLPLNKPLLWTKNSADTRKFDKQHSGFFIDWRWMEDTSDAAGVIRFLERIRQGEDEKAVIRQSILHRDLPMADGHSGERVCEEIWTLIHQEDLEKQ